MIWLFTFICMCVYDMRDVCVSIIIPHSDSRCTRHHPGSTPSHFSPRRSWRWWVWSTSHTDTTSSIPRWMSYFRSRNPPTSWTPDFGTRRLSGTISMQVSLFWVRSFAPLHLEPQATLHVYRVWLGWPSDKGTKKMIKLRSRMVASDWILEIPEDKSKLKEAWTLNLTDARIEYLVRDVNHKLRGQNVTVSLNAEYMPIVGKFFSVRKP